MTRWPFVVFMLAFPICAKLGHPQCVPALLWYAVMFFIWIAVGLMLFPVPPHINRG